MSFYYCYIMRGIPGSGKSTVARQLASHGGMFSSYVENSTTYFGDEDSVHGAIHSTDMFFHSGSEGKYNFVPYKLGDYHSQNFKNFCDSIEKGIPVVVCDNTNTTTKEYERYLKKAQREGYITSIVTLPHPPIDIAVERNLHNVPREAIEKMLKRWEP